jgi:hypothetical protein
VAPQLEPAFNQANTGVIQAQAAFAAANNVAPQLEPAYNQANNAYNQANTGVIQAQAAFAAANNVAPQLEPAFNQANTGVIQAQAAFAQANTANTNAANASFLTTGIVGTSRLATSGTSNSTTYLRGDQSWSIPGPSLIVDNTTNDTFYIGLSTGTTAVWTSAYLSTTKLKFNPGTGNLSSSLVNATSGFRFNGLGISGQYLRGDGTNFVSSDIQAADVPTLNQNTTGSAATFTSTTQNSQFNSIGVNATASGVAGEIRATGIITAGYSDDRLKTKLGTIDNALEKLISLEGFYYEANEVAKNLGYESVKEVGVSAQQVQKVLPEIVVPAPIDDKYLTVRYEKLVPLLIEAIKEQQDQINYLKSKIETE